MCVGDVAYTNKQKYTCTSDVDVPIVPLQFIEHYQLGYYYFFFHANSRTRKIMHVVIKTHMNEEHSV